MNTLAVVEQVLLEMSEPVTVRQIVKLAGVRLPSKSRTPETVVARDLALDIKRLGEQSRFVRTAPGLYALRTLTTQATPSTAQDPTTTTDLVAAALRQERPSTSPTTISSVSPQSARSASHDHEMVG